MKPSGFNVQYTVKAGTHYSADTTDRAENLPREGSFSPGRVVWLDRELDGNKNEPCRVYCDGVGFVEVDASKLVRQEPI